jgi:hypothetical protein
MHALSGIRTRGPSNRAAVDLRRRLHGQRDRLRVNNFKHKFRCENF